MDANNRYKNLNSVKWLAQLLDSQFTGPWGIKFGLDAIIGLVPVFGDAFTSLFSFYIIVQAARSGCSPVVLIRMALNVLLEDFIGVLPVIGNIFDFYWKSNNKNVDLFERYHHSPEATTRHSAFVVGGTLVAILATMIALFAGAIYITFAVISFLTGSH